MAVSDKRLRVLIAEDSEDDLLLLTREFSREGFILDYGRVETASAMKRALAAREWDIVISDYFMPRFSAPAALEALKESGLDIPFIIVSGKIGEDAAVEAMKAGAHDYILKGNLARLVPAVERELREADVRRGRRAAEEELKNSREQLRSLSAHLQAVREEERTRIAREVHDELGQALTALKMDISWLGDKYKEHPLPLLHEKTKSMLNIIDSTIKTVRKISAELRPLVLDDFGLIAAIEWHAEDFSKRTGIACDVTFSPEEIGLDKDRSSAIFRIFQEALTNVMRHAEASRVTVSLEEKDSKVSLRIADNGKGFDEESACKPRSFGLIGMRERVHFFGGHVRIEGIPGRGTSITVKIPVERIS